MNYKRKVSIYKESQKRRKLEVILSFVPVEIWYHILSFVDWDKADSIKLTCKSWYEYIKNHTYYFETKNIVKILEIYPNLRELIFTGPNFPAKFKKFGKIKKLTMKGVNPGGNYGLNETQIETLILIGSCEHYKKCVKYILEDVAESDTIKSLTIDGKIGYCQRCKVCYERLTNIEELSLFNIAAFHDEILVSITKLSNLKKLTIVNVEIKGTHDGSFNILGTMTNLKQLTISNDLLTGIEADYLKKVFEENGQKLILDKQPLYFPTS